MPGLEALPDAVELVRVPGRNMAAAQVKDADALLVRSVTRVDQALLAGSRVRFVGSATIGTDHLDLHWLKQAGIAPHHAPGCNAMAVAEYVLQSVLHWLLDQARRPEEVRVGLLGAGNVGARVGWLLDALGFEVLFSDPPREQAGERAPVGEWAEAGELLDCDVISLHVPLTDDGPWRTRHWLDQTGLARLRAGQLLINTCRGPVIDNQALEHRLQQEPALRVVLDVWEAEPLVPPSLFQRVAQGTPHIAGYSVEGKVRGTYCVLNALARHAGWSWSAPSLAGQERTLAGNVDSLADLLALLRQAYIPERDHRSLSEALNSDDAAREFDRLRRQYPPRHELGGGRVDQVSPGFQSTLSRLGVGWGRETASGDPAARWLRESCAR